MLMILIIDGDPSIHRPRRSGIPATNVNHILRLSGFAITTSEPGFKTEESRRNPAGNFDKSLRDAASTTVAPSLFFNF